MNDDEFLFCLGDHDLYLDEKLPTNGRFLSYSFAQQNRPVESIDRVATRIRVFADRASGVRFVAEIADAMGEADGAFFV